MNVAGLDISTKHLDFVILDTDNPSECEHRRVTLATEDGRWWESARRMRVTLSGATHWLHDNDVRLLGIERPYGPSRQAIASLHVVLGAVLASLDVSGRISTLEVRPAEMRKALGLKGNVDKEEMHSAIIKTLGGHVFTYETNRADPWPDDAYDAWAVAWAAYRMCEKAAGGEGA